MRINEVDRPMMQADIDQLEIFADRLFAKVGIDVEFTRHFLDRVNDERNIKQITVSELTRLFKQEFKKWGKPIAQMGPDTEAVMKDMATNINMPFALRWDDTNQELDLIAKTIMRKADFKTSNQEFAVEDELTEYAPLLLGIQAAITAAGRLLAKRGIKIEPSNSIRGYGDEVHSTTSAPGLFSFGVRAVAPPAGTSKAFTSTDDIANTNAGGGFIAE